MLSRFHLIPERYGRTDGQTDRFAISILRVSMLTRDKNPSIFGEAVDKSVMSHFFDSRRRRHQITTRSSAVAETARVTIRSLIPVDRVTFTVRLNSRTQDNGVSLKFGLEVIQGH